jgi:hypothetical protein
MPVQERPMRGPAAAVRTAPTPLPQLPQRPLRDVLQAAGPPLEPEATDPYEKEVEAGMAGYHEVRRQRDNFKRLYDEQVRENERLTIRLESAAEREREHVATVVSEAKAHQAAAEERAEVLRAEVAQLQQLVQQHDNEAAAQYARLRNERDAAVAETAKLTSRLALIRSAIDTTIGAPGEEPDADTTG